MENEKLFQDIKNSDNFTLIPPVSFLEIIQLEKNAKMVITDSGGVQKEAYFFNKPCIILRSQTEWVEIVETGMAKLAESDFEKIMHIYNDFKTIQKPSFPSIFGDGNAANFICKQIISNN